MEVAFSKCNQKTECDSVRINNLNWYTMKTHFPSNLFNAACFLQHTKTAEVDGILWGKDPTKLLRIFAYPYCSIRNFKYCELLFVLIFIKMIRCLQNLHLLLPWLPPSPLTRQETGCLWILKLDLGKGWQGFQAGELQQTLLLVLGQWEFSVFNQGVLVPCSISAKQKTPLGICFAFSVKKEGFVLALRAELFINSCS